MIDRKAAKAALILAQHGSFSLSAEVMETSAASFSRYIKQAEEYAGQSLFERSRLGVLPTPAGKAFLKMLVTLEDSISQFEEGAERLQQDGANLLKIGCGPLAARAVVSPLVSQMLEEHPEFRSRIAVRASKEPLSALRTGILDVAISDLTHTPDVSGIEVLVLKKRKTAFWARPQHPLHRKAPATVAEIFSYPVATPYLPDYWRSLIARLLGDNQDAYERVSRMPQIESDDYSLLNDIACSTDLICGGMPEDFEQYRRMGLLKEIQSVEELTWNICAARRSSAGFPALNTLWDKIADQFCD
ncbi:LysR family transcriptional regulator [Aliiroseovarius halocynthiae]|uniref:LysR substrate-binding domain-containing protein n=1 Tax=Aliiroseovarius halocynthiae TaxID=985055 RepID=UPI0024B6DF6C|nr:LysR family transcriptional regulator [Aliiroseovarius halocynthiae]